MNTAELLSLASIDGMNAMLDASHRADAADLAARQTATFRAQTGKRKFSAPFAEDGETWILDSQGHQWCWVDGAWVRFTDEDDAYVIDVRRAKRAV